MPPKARAKPSAAKKKSPAKAAAPKKTTRAPVVAVRPKTVAVSRKPTLPQIPKLALAPPIKPIVAMLRRLIREAAPQAAEVLSGRGYQFSAHGVFARVEASDRKVLLEFVNGGSLEAPDGVLAGEGPVRNLALTSVDDVTESVLRGLVRQAVLKNLGGGSSS